MEAAGLPSFIPARVGTTGLPWGPGINKYYNKNNNKNKGT